MVQLQVQRPEVPSPSTLTSTRTWDRHTLAAFVKGAIVARLLGLVVGSVLGARTGGSEREAGGTRRGHR